MTTAAAPDIAPPPASAPPAPRTETTAEMFVRLTEPLRRLELEDLRNRSAAVARAMGSPAIEAALRALPLEAPPKIGVDE